MDKLLHIYLQDISQYERIHPNDEIKLVYRSQNGDNDATKRLIHGNLKFVIHVAKRFAYQGIELIDLISVGNIGLIESISRFDPKKGYKLITYSVWWIKQKILEYINNYSRLIRIPMNKSAIANKITSILNDIDYNQPSSTTIYHICNKFGLSEYELTILMNIHLSGIDEYRDVFILSSDVLFIDTFENDLFNDEDFVLINQALNILNDREKLIAIKYFGLNQESQTLESIGEDLNLTRERIRQIKDKITSKLRLNILKYITLNTSSHLDNAFNNQTLNDNFFDLLSCHKIKNYNTLSNDECSNAMHNLLNDELLNQLYESL